MPLPMYDKNRLPEPSMIRNILAVAAGKGGVGKSTVAVNLAFALQAQGCRVGIMDTDIYGPSLRRMLPEERMPIQQGNKIIPALCSGMPMISMAYFRRDNEAAVVRAPIANGIIMQFISQVDWGELDYLIIDFPPGTGDIQLTLSQKANITGAVMVTTPQDVAVMDVRKAMHMFEQVNIPIVGIVENMSFYVDNETGKKVHIFGQGGGRRLAEESEVPFLGEIPLSPELCQSGEEGLSIFRMNNAGKCQEAFSAVAENVAARVNALKTQGSPGLQNFELKWQEMKNR